MEKQNINIVIVEHVDDGSHRTTARAFYDSEKAEAWYKQAIKENLTDWDKDHVKTKEYARRFEIWSDNFNLIHDIIMIKTIQIE